MIAIAEQPRSAVVEPCELPLVSLVLPAYNEAMVVQKNLAVLCDYMESLKQKYDYEIILVNDGSIDQTSALAHQFASGYPNVRVIDHPMNFGLGQALKSAFNQCRGEQIVTLDMDLSYSPDHIERLLDHLRDTGAKIVIASPYTCGGLVENVPTIRRWLSRTANKFLSIAAHGRIKTLTGMVRAYDAKFLHTLDFYSMGMEVNSEILYKAMLLRARIEEIPAVLRWEPVDSTKPARRSSIKIPGYLLTLMVSGFLYRPIMFFLLPAIALLIFAAVAVALRGSTGASICIAAFFLAAVQMLCSGLLSLQNKCYFEQMFHLGTTTYRSSREGRK